jgi:ATP-binding protein involved in chromosome partitioning
VQASDEALYRPVADAAEAALRAGLAGVERVQVVLTADRAPSPQAGPRTVQRPREPQAPAPMRPPHVKHVLAVASGKGGVGKSTVAVNLACAFSQLGLSVGLLDADVYGPSVPMMTGLRDKPAKRTDGKIEPLQAFGLKIMSIGLLVEDDSAMIWRGPMASGAVTQMLNDVAWASAEAPLDVLVIDMPPGTGDIQLTLAQRVALSGAVVVSTPQDVALIDVRRGISMFEKTRAPILGVVENMAYFPDPSTGAPIAIFGRGGAQATAKALGVPFLGEIPIDPALRQSCDEGVPLVVQAPDSAAARALIEIARQVAVSLEQGEGLKPAPRILFDS